MPIDCAFVHVFGGQPQIPCQTSKCSVIQSEKVWESWVRKLFRAGKCSGKTGALGIQLHRCMRIQERQGIHLHLEMGVGPIAQQHSACRIRLCTAEGIRVAHHGLAVLLLFECRIALALALRRLGIVQRRPCSKHMTVWRLV